MRSFHARETVSATRCAHGEPETELLRQSERTRENRAGTQGDGVEGEDFDAASSFASCIGVGAEDLCCGLFHTETRRHGEGGVPNGASATADFMKTAGERKPHFIKCGFGEAAEMAVDLEVA